MLTLETRFSHEAHTKRVSGPVLSITWMMDRMGAVARDEFSLPRAHINFRRCQEALDGFSRFKVAVPSSHSTTFIVGIHSLVSRRVCGAKLHSMTVHLLQKACSAQVNCPLLSAHIVCARHQHFWCVKL